jgi:hypothetical protein
MLASGVTYYPPLPAQAPSHFETAETGSPLLDVSVEKLIRIVQREAAKLDDETLRAANALGRVELNDAEVEDESMREQVSGSPCSETSSSSLSLGRAPSKRRRNHLDLDPAHADYRRSDPDPLDVLKKDMLSVLECDVCAMLLHEPVTTPCQHVGASALQIGCLLTISHSARNVFPVRWIIRLGVLFVDRIYLPSLSSRIIPSTRFF